MKTFMITYRQGSAWVEGKTISEQPLQEHGAYILELYREGKLRFAGPFEDESGGAAEIEVINYEAAQAIADQDPAGLNQLLVYEIRPWQLIAWERYGNA